MFGIGGMEFVLILVVALVVLGPDHLPRVMRMVGKTVGDLRRASTEFQRTMNSEMADSEKEAEEKPKELPAAHPLPDPEEAQAAPAGTEAATTAAAATPPSARRTIRVPSPRIKRAAKPEPAPEAAPEPIPAPVPEPEAPRQEAAPKTTGVQAASRRRAAAKPLRRSTHSGGEKQ